MHLMFRFISSGFGIHSLRHRSSVCPMWPHLAHFMMSTSVQFLASWPLLLHLKQIFSVQSKESCVVLPQRMQEFFFVSLGQSCYLCPIYLQLWHLIVGLTSAQYRCPFSFISLLKASSSSVYSSSLLFPPLVYKHRSFTKLKDSSSSDFLLVLSLICSGLSSSDVTPSFWVLS